MSDDISLPSPHEPLVDRASGRVNEVWYRYFNGLNLKVNGINRATTLAALPSTSDLDVGKWAVFKDSSGGSVRLAYNDNSTVVTVALTT
jgi:hypothetical protein